MKSRDARCGAGVSAGGVVAARYARRDDGRAAYNAARSANCRALRAQARSHFEGGGLSLVQIGKAVGRTPWTITRWAREEGWTPSARRPGRKAGDQPVAADRRRRLVGRLFAAFERQVAQVEAEAAGGPPGEAEVKVLAALARTLEVLVELDRSVRAEAASAASQAEAKVEAEVDVDALRDEIARRLEGLAAG